MNNNVEIEFYRGSMKGSRGTLLERAGNDVDTSSLLLALLRAANVPSRYVEGTIELTVSEAQNLTGVSDANNIGTLFASAGIPGVLITSGPDVVAVRIEHTWTEAYVDYDPYAGARSGPGDVWVPISPWYKPLQHDEGSDLYVASGFDSSAFRAPTSLGFRAKASPGATGRSSRPIWRRTLRARAGRRA